MILDFFGALFSLISTYFFIRLDKRAWSIGSLAILLNISLYFQKGIYADMLLESGYLVTLIWGWRLWSNDKNKNALDIRSLTPGSGLLAALIFFLLFLIIYTILIRFTDSTVPFLDALTTALSLIAQGLMCYKFIATWVLWFIVDAIYALLYAQKSIPFHSLLMLVYTLMAVFGFYSWSRARNSNPSSPALQL